MDTTAEYEYIPVTKNNEPRYTIRVEITLSSDGRLGIRTIDDPGVAESA